MSFAQKKPQASVRFVMRWLSVTGSSGSGSREDYSSMASEY
jgi:hypothetical protein